jgi:hypothetical protein
VNEANRGRIPGGAPIITCHPELVEGHFLKRTASPRTKNKNKMTAFNLTIAALTIAVFVGFIGWSCIQIFTKDIPAKSNNRKNFMI